jgi:hypothetical protein
MAMDDIGTKASDFSGEISQELHPTASTTERSEATEENVSVFESSHRFVPAHSNVNLVTLGS